MLQCNEISAKIGVLKGGYEGIEKVTFCFEGQEKCHGGGNIWPGILK